jgi:hypothetical protein
MFGRSSPAWLANIRLHPIKGLDPVSVPEARIGPNGGLALDRVWALFGSDGQWVNAKRTAAIQRIRAEYDPGVSTVVLSGGGSNGAGTNGSGANRSGAGGKGMKAARFAFPADYERAAAWFSEYFAQPVIVRHIPEGAPDDGLAPGPTIVSTASLQCVSDLFSAVDLQEARERFRTTLEIDGVPAFWEDELFGESENYVKRFKIGDVAFEGAYPCARCPVPPRHPRTGADLVGFQKRFTEMRRTSLPESSPAAPFDHYYRFATNTRVPSTEQGKLLRVGDAVIL